MKMRIIRLAIGLTALIASFLPQKAQAAFCSVDCLFGSCFAFGEEVSCECSWGFPHCEAS